MPFSPKGHPEQSSGGEVLYKKKYSVTLKMAGQALSRRIVIGVGTTAEGFLQWERDTGLNSE